MTRCVLVALVALPLLASCGSAPGAPHASETPTGDYVSDGLPGPFDEGDVLRVTFREGEISFQATCNSMFGSTDLVDGLLVVSNVGGTEMGCPGAGHEQDEWLVDFFTSRPAIDLLDVGFDLTHDGTTVRFLAPDAASDEDVRLGSVVWQLTGIEQTDGDSVSMSQLRDGTLATLDVTGAHFVLETGCNTASGTAFLGDGDVEITEMLVTERGCPVDRMDQERLQLAALDGDVTWSIDGDQLRLGNDRVVLLYEAGR